MNKIDPDFARFDWKHADVDVWVDYTDVRGAVFGALAVAPTSKTKPKRFVSGMPRSFLGQPSDVSRYWAMTWATDLEDLAASAAEKATAEDREFTLGEKALSLVLPLAAYDIVQKREMYELGHVEASLLVRKHYTSNLSIVLVLAEEARDYRFISPATAIKIAEFIKQNATSLE